MNESVEQFLARGGKMTEVAAGETAPFKTITQKAKDLQLTLAAGQKSFTGPYHIRRNKDKPKSGHQNIRIQKTTIAVYFGHSPHKTFKKGNNEAAALKLALECRDKVRIAMGLPPAEF